MDMNKIPEIIADVDTLGDPREVVGQGEEEGIAALSLEGGGESML